MAMNSLSLTDEQVRDLCTFLGEGLAVVGLKRQAITLAHGGRECPDCLALFDGKTLAMQNLYNKLTEFAP